MDLSHLKRGVRNPITEVQRLSCASWGYCERWFWSICGVHWIRLVCVADDCSKSHGCHRKTTRLWLTSSRRKTCVAIKALALNLTLPWCTKRHFNDHFSCALANALLETVHVTTSWTSFMCTPQAHRRAFPMCAGTGGASGESMITSCISFMMHATGPSTIRFPVRSQMRFWGQSMITSWMSLTMRGTDTSTTLCFKMSSTSASTASAVSFLMCATRTGREGLANSLHAAEEGAGPPPVLILTLFETPFEVCVWTCVFAGSHLSQHMFYFHFLERHISGEAGRWPWTSGDVKKWRGMLEQNGVWELLYPQKYSRGKLKVRMSRSMDTFFHDTDCLNHGQMLKTQWWSHTCGIIEGKTVRENVIRSGMGESTELGMPLSVFKENKVSSYRCTWMT